MLFALILVKGTKDEEGRSKTFLLTECNMGFIDLVKDPSKDPAEGKYPTEHHLLKWKIFVDRSEPDP